MAGTMTAWALQFPGLCIFYLHASSSNTNHIVLAFALWLNESLRLYLWKHILPVPTSDVNLMTITICPS